MGLIIVKIMKTFRTFKVMHFFSFSKGIGKAIRFPILYMFAFIFMVISITGANNNIIFNVNRTIENRENKFKNKENRNKNYAESNSNSESIYKMFTAQLINIKPSDFGGIFVTQSIIKIGNDFPIINRTGSINPFTTERSIVYSCIII